MTEQAAADFGDWKAAVMVYFACEEARSEFAGCYHVPVGGTERSGLRSGLVRSKYGLGRGRGLWRFER